MQYHEILSSMKQLKMWRMNKPYLVMIILELSIVTSYLENQYNFIAFFEVINGPSLQLTS